MFKAWGNLSPVFASLTDGRLWEDVDKFEDDQLTPFLPLLVAQSFSNVTDEYHAKLMGRISSFSEGNRTLKLLMSDFSAVEQAFIDGVPINGMFSQAEEEEKVAIVLHCFLKHDRKDDPLTQSLLCEDNIAETVFLFKIAYLRLPHLFIIDRLTMRILTMPNAISVLVSLICVAPELLEPVLTLLKMLQVSDECSKGRCKAMLLSHIFMLQPAVMWPVLEDLSLSRRDCLMAVRLACDNLNDEDVVAYLVTQLIHRENDTFICQMISRSTARGTLNVIYERLMKIGKTVLKKNPQEPLTDVLRLVAFLQQHCVAKLSVDQLSTLCGLLCRPVGDDTHVILATVIIMAVPPFTHMQHQAGVINSVDERIPRYFSWLKDIVMGHERPFLVQNLIYIATCVYSSKRDQLGAMFTELLRTKVSIVTRHLDALTAIMTENFLKSEEVSRECSQLPITDGLSGNSGTRLPLNSVYTCFMVHGIDIGSWLERQLSSCSFPIHPLLPELIERFAAQAVYHKRAGLSKHFIKETFDGELIDESKLAQRVLSFLFLLSYRWNLESMGPKGLECHGPEIFSKLPVRYLLSVVTSRQEHFGAIQAALIRLATDICPYMLPTVDSVQVVNQRKRKRIHIDTAEDKLMSALSTTEGLISVARRLQNVAISDQVNCLRVVTRAFVASLAEDSPVPVVEAVVSIYTRLEDVVPRMLYEESAREWLRRGEAELADLYDYPSLLFRCDRRILSSPLHFRCFIRALAFFRDASKNALMRKIHAANHTMQSDQDKADREVLSTAFEHTQMSLLVQLLIEVSDEKRMKDDMADEAALRRRGKIRSIACEYIHQIFIADKQLMRLVLFQGLPLHMVPHLVEEIPCMYVANEFMQEMLSLPDMNRRIFGTCLMVHISKKYRIAAHCTTIDMVLDILNTLLRYTESGLNVKMFLRIVPTLIHVSSIFPQLAADVTHLLMRVSSLAKSRLSLHPLMIRPGCDERGLLDLISKSMSQQIDLEAW